MEFIVKAGREIKEETWTDSIDLIGERIQFFSSKHMSFWSSTTAAPQWWHTLFPTKPGYLRSAPAEQPTNIHNLFLRRVSISAAEPITVFWNTYYRGSDWYMDVRSEWVANYLRDPHVIVVCAYDSTNNIKATIVSTPVSAKPVIMSHGSQIPLRCIEGLCVADDMRGTGIAGIMIQTVDYLTSQTGPQAHIWCRELPIDPLVFTTAASIKTYAYIEGTKAAAASQLRAIRIPWEHFQEIWNPYRYSTSSHTIVAVSPSNRNNGLDVWSVEFRGRTFYIVVLHTHRRITGTHQPIYEILWSSQVNEMVYTSVASQYKNSVIFTTDANDLWRNGWIYGRSGVHAIYLYNYLPPIFRNCEFVMLREEI
jgi:hypothetical protein